MKNKGAACFVMHRGELLLLLRDDIPTISNPCRHAFFSGTIEFGESSADTITREFLEEFSFSVCGERFLFLGTEYIPSAKAINDFFVLEITDEERYSIVLTEGQSYDFYSYDSLSELFLRGDVKYGLGGAIYRFMMHNRNVVQKIFAQSHASSWEQFDIVR